MRKTVRTGALTLLGKASAVGLLILACLGAFWLGWVNPKKADSGVELTVPREALNFGEVWETPTFHWTLPVENRSGKDITVSDIVSSCGCLTVEPRSFTIASGQKVNVGLTLSLAGRSDQEESLAARDFAVQLIPRIENGESQEAGWIVHGKIRRPVTLSPNSVNFGDRLIRGKPYVVEKVVATAHLPVKELRILSDYKFLSARIRPMEGINNKFEVEVVPLETMASGPFQFDLRLLAIDYANKEHCVSVPVVGKVMEDVQAVPSSLYFGVLSVSESVSQVVTLHSVGGEPFEIENVEVDSPDVSVDSAPPRVEAGQGFLVKVQMVREGGQHGWVRFSIRDKNQRSMIVPLELFWYGTSVRRETKQDP